MYRLLPLVGLFAFSCADDADVSGSAAALSSCSGESKERFEESMQAAFFDDPQALAEAATVRDHGLASLASTFEDVFFLIEFCQSIDDVGVDCSDHKALRSWAKTCRTSVGPWTFWEFEATGDDPSLESGIEVTNTRGMLLALPNKLPVDDSKTFTVAFSDEGAVSVAFSPGDDNGADSTLKLPATNGRFATVGSFALELSAHDNSEFFVDARLSFYVED